MGTLLSHPYILASICVLTIVYLARRVARWCRWIGILKSGQPTLSQVVLGTDVSSMREAIAAHGSPDEDGVYRDWNGDNASPFLGLYCFIVVDALFVIALSGMLIRLFNGQDVAFPEVAKTTLMALWYTLVLWAFNTPTLREIAGESGRRRRGNYGSSENAD